MRRGENRSTRGKTSQRIEDYQQTQPTYDAESEIEPTTALRPCFNMTLRNLFNNNNNNNNSDDDDDDDDDDDNLLVNGKSLNVCSKCSCPLCQENLKSLSPLFFSIFDEKLSHP